MLGDVLLVCAHDSFPLVLSSEETCQVAGSARHTPVSYISVHFHPVGRSARSAWPTSSTAYLQAPQIVRPILFTLPARSAAQPSRDAVEKHRLILSPPCNIELSLDVGSRHSLTDWQVSDDDLAA